MKFTLVLCFQYLDLFLIFLHCAEGESFSRRPGIVQRGKALINESALKSPPRGGKEVPSQLPWSNKLRAGINQYINKYGYQDAKTHIEKLVEETETAENVLLNVKVAHNGTIDIDFVPVLRSSKHKKENKRGLQFEPQWLVEFKEFIKALIQSYGRENVEKMMEPFIKTIEIKNLVKIKDIDVNPYGEVFVQYEHLKKSNKRKKGPRHQFKSSVERSRQMSSEETVRGTKSIQD